MPVVTRSFIHGWGEVALPLLMSIRPYHAEHIYDGTKAWEFRRVCPRIPSGDQVVLYETSPVCLVTGAFWVETTLRGSPAYLAALESDDNDRRLVYAYLQGASTPGALQVTRPARRRQAVHLDRLGLSRPPRSYIYIETLGWW